MSEEAMTERELEEIEKRAEAATEGPWKADLDIDAEDQPIEAGVLNDSLSIWFIESTEIMCREQTDWKRAKESQPYKDAEFIAHARQDIPNLLSEVRRSHAEAAEVRERYWLKQDVIAELHRERVLLENRHAELRERVESLEGALRKITKAHKFRPSNTFGKITWAIAGFDEKAVLRKCMEIADAALSQAEPANAQTNAQAEPDTRSEEEEEG